MRSRVALRVLALALVLAIGILPVALVRAHHSALVQKVIDVAQQVYGMKCGQGDGELLCDASDFDGTWHTHASIKPGSAAEPLVSLYTIAAVRVAPLDSYFRGWHFDMHQVGCAPDRTTAGQLNNFVATVGNMTSAGNAQPLTIAGECDLTGGLIEVVNQDGSKEYRYWINAGVIVPPPPTPAPTPPPTPPATVTPPPTPTASPTPKPTATSTAKAAPTATPNASASASPTPTGSPTASATRTPRPSPSATPEQTVAGITFAPEPSAPRPDVAEDSIPWAASVHGLADVSIDPAAVGTSAALAVLLMLFMGFIGELFNNTVKANYDEIRGWWVMSWPGRLVDAWGRLWRSGP